ncbi:MAG: hypothetical protein AB4062_16740 [Crocosphaera sp.]
MFSFLQPKTENDNQQKSAIRINVDINLSTQIVMAILGIIAALLGIGPVLNLEPTPQLPPNVESQMESEKQ